MISALFRLSRFRRIFRRPATRRDSHFWGGLRGAIRIEALDRGDSWTSCQLEHLEQRKLLAVDVSLIGTVLTVAFDDSSDDAISLSINTTGYTTSGANTTSGTGTIK